MATWAWALDFQPVDKDGGPNPAAVPIGDVLGASVSYGVKGDSLNTSGGTMTLELDNTDSAYTPDAGNTYSNARFLNVIVKLYAEVTGAGAPTWTHGPPAAFTGVVTDIQYTFSDTYAATVTVTVVDLLTMLGTLVFDSDPIGFTLDSATDGVLDTSQLGFDFTEGLTLASNPAATMIDRLLRGATALSSQINQNAVVNPANDPGPTLQGITNSTATAGALLTTMSQTVGGSLYVRHGLPIDATTPYNSLTFRSRGRPNITEVVTGVNELTALNLWDARLTPSGTEPHYFSTVNFLTGSTASYSQVSYTSVGGTTQQASSNVDEFGGRSISRSGLLSLTDADTLASAQAFLSEYGTDGAPPLNVSNIKLQPIVEGQNDSWQYAKYSIGDTTTLELRPEGSTATLSFTGVITGVKWHITPQKSQLSVQLDPATRLVHFTLDSADYCELDTDLLGY